jgi:hypothetical protein
MRSEPPLTINANSFCSPPPQWVGSCQVIHKIWQSWLFPESQTSSQSQCCRPVSIPFPAEPWPLPWRQCQTGIIASTRHHSCIGLKVRSRGTNFSILQIHHVGSFCATPSATSPAKPARTAAPLLESPLQSAPPATAAPPHRRWDRRSPSTILIISRSLHTICKPLDRMDRERKWAAIVMRASNAWSSLRRCSVSEWKIGV